MKSEKRSTFVRNERNTNRKASAGLNKSLNATYNTFSSKESELIETFPIAAQVYIGQQEKIMKLKDDKANLLLKQANIRILQLSQDISLRRVIEELEKDEFVVEALRRCKDNLKSINSTGNPSKKDVWTEVFNGESAAD
jgi:4-hydroxy-L-threonine phosphate dehydrogenase PdxA